MTSKLYVGNFPWATTENELRGIFEQYGEVRSVKIIMDKETNRSRGFAFIEFVNSDDAVAAMESENGRDMGGRELKVREAVDKPRAPRDSAPTREFNPPRQTQTTPPPERSNGNVKRQRDRKPRRDSNRDFQD